jgi:hypothetical protein
MKKNRKKKKTEEEKSNTRLRQFGTAGACCRTEDISKRCRVGTPHRGDPLVSDDAATRGKRFPHGWRCPSLHTQIEIDLVVAPPLPPVHRRWASRNSVFHHVYQDVRRWRRPMFKMQEGTVTMERS